MSKTELKLATIEEKLEFVYEIIMQTVRVGLLNARGARTGYTHWFARELSKDVRYFSGYVSEAAVAHGQTVGLVLEHPHRIQTTLTQLISKHIEQGENVEEFVSEVKRLEKVHIVVKSENDLLKRKDISGDYSKAGIKLLYWNEIPHPNRRHLLKKLSGNIANIDDFKD
ncbi:hypothetical protein BK026_06665 [Alteromonas sp. V450]|uniref:hypothetical protein n=1 Tax=Alteromonas sp. V450 TaxID=1912139 RepID=UPI0008FF2123|nr:hypothetical protein [Alteromonas sp. V450]OJF68495.1 hypothetical protein BK026_06665 [Alteromonas sp. V450]